MIDYDDAGKILSEMVQISRTFRIAGQRSGEQSFSGTRFGFLQHLRTCDSRLGELAHRLLISAPVASRAVDSLEAEGMVERRPDPLDARASLISITALTLPEESTEVVPAPAAAQEVNESETPG